jgi:hypothetical protein
MDRRLSVGSDRTGDDPSMGRIVTAGFRRIHSPEGTTDDRRSDVGWPIKEANAESSLSTHTAPTIERDRRSLDRPNGDNTMCTRWDMCSTDTKEGADRAQ